MTQRDETTYGEELAFNHNLAEFANQVGIVCALEQGEKISQRDAYRRIRDLWRELKESRNNLRIGE